MNPDEKDILHAVLDALRADEKLKGYVKSFSVGAPGGAVKLYPFVSAGNIMRSVGPRTIGAGGVDNFTYSFEIRCGARNMTPGLAYDGGHGVLQLCEDIVDAVKHNSFGVFDDPVRIRNVETSFGADSGGSLWIGSIGLEGVRGIRRPV